MSAAEVDPTDYFEAMRSGSRAERAFHPARLKLISAAAKWEGRRVLEVGAGSGCVAIPLAEAGADLVAVELGFEHLQRLRAYALDRGLKIPVIQADAGRLPFADDSFDVVVLASLVHLTDRPGPMLREAERVCRPDGRLVIAGPWDRHPKSMVWVKTLLRGGKPPTMKTWPFNVPKLRRLLPRSTFVSARTERLIGYVVTVWRPDREPLRA